MTRCLLTTFCLLLLLTPVHAQERRRAFQAPAAASGDITTGLQFAFPLTANANDTSGNGNHLTLNGDAAVATGNLNLDGTGDDATHVDAANLNDWDGDFTIIVRARVDSGHAATMFILNKGTGSTQVGLYQNAAGVLTLELYRNPTDDILTAAGTINDDSFHRIVAIRDGGTMKLIVDGAAAVTASTTAGDVSSANAFSVGSSGNSSSYLFGKVRQVYGYNRVLTTADIALWDATNP